MTNHHANLNAVIHPYHSQTGQSLLDLLVAELDSGLWTKLQIAVAFLRQSGNFSKLLEAMQKFLTQGGVITLTAGADSFSGQADGSDYEAVGGLLSNLGGFSDFYLYLYHEPHRTFHPKIYLFSNDDQAVLFIGSSNWSRGGLFNNVEANLRLHLDLQSANHREQFEVLQGYFRDYWADVAHPSQIGQGFARRVTLDNLSIFAPYLRSPASRKTASANRESSTSSSTHPSPFSGQSIRTHTAGRIVRPSKPISTVSESSQVEIENFSEADKGRLLWEKKNLPPSDVQRQAGNVTGGIRLTQARFEVNGQRINQTTYFRHDVFGHLNWSVGTYPPKKREAAQLLFWVNLLGQDYGIQPLIVSHKPSGEAGQKNYTTLLHWGTLAATVQSLNLVGGTFRLYAPADGEAEPFFIEIV